MAGATPPGDPPWDASKVPEKNLTIIGSNRLTQSWPGPRTVSLQRCDGGFGFTLRHFIVYPPENSKSHADNRGGDVEGAGREKAHNLPLEPMDTIFVKHVKEGSPAQRAGLNTGDRVVSVNGETIAGKSYPQVVQLIQRSGNVLQLLVVPKEDDILQLYFPGTAYRSSPDCHHLQESGSPCMNSSSSSSSQQSPSSTPAIPQPMAALRMDPSAQSHAPSANDKRTFSCATNSSSLDSDAPPPGDLGRRRFSELPSMFHAEVASIMPARSGVNTTSTWSVASMGLGLGLGIGLGLGTSMDEKNRAWSNCDLSCANTCTTIAGTTSTVTVNVSGTRPTFATSASSAYYSPMAHYESRATKPWRASPQVTTANQLPPLLPCPPAREYTTSGNAEFGRKVPLRYDGPYASIESIQPQESFSMSQDSLSLPSGTPPPSLSTGSSREPSIERPDDNIINRLKASFEKKEEFLLRPTKCDATSYPLPSPLLPATNGTVVKEYYPHPQRFMEPHWPPLATDLEKDPEKLMWPSSKTASTETITHDSALSSPSLSPSQSSSSQSLFTYCPVATAGSRTTMLNSSGDLDDSATIRPGKAFISSLSRIQENIPSSEQRQGSEQRHLSQIRPLESNGHVANMASLVKAPLLGGRILRNAPLRKACSLDSELLPSRQGSGSGSGGSTNSVDNNPEAGRMSALHLVSQRARQFELGALEQEANNRMNFYKNELARLTTRGQTPRVSDRAAQFESLSTSQETLGSESDYCPSPRQKATAVDARKENSTSRLRSYGDATSKNCVSMASAVVSSSMIPMTAAASSMDNSNSLYATNNRGRQESALTCSDPSLIDEDLQRHKAVRQNSYLAAVKAPFKGSHPGGTKQSSTSTGHLTTSTAAAVNLRRKAIYEEEDEESRAVRRVSYLKATSGECVKGSGETDEHASRHRQHFEANKSGSHAGSKSQSIQKLKAFFGERTPQIVEATERKPLQEYPSETNSPPSTETVKEGWMHCKLACCDGKKATDRSWKQLWAVLKGSSLYLYKDKKDVASQTLATVDEHPIDLKCCQLVDVANDYTKKKHVFRLITSSGSEYLLQADSNSDMQRWIRIIQENLDVSGKGTITQGIVMRKSALFEREIGHLSPQPGPKGIRKLTTFRNRSPTGHSPTNKARKSSQGDETSPKSKTWRGKMVKTIRKIHGTSPTSASLPEGVTIGIPLDECPPSSVNEFVPLLVELCTSIVEARGLEVIGIYRVPGNTAAVSFLLDAVNHGFESLNLQDPRWNDVNVISSLLKAFFRKLPEPLVTCELYPCFIEASKLEDPVHRMISLKKMLHELPDHNYETLKYLTRHLQKIVAHSGINKMEARNLAIVFGPTLVRAADDNMVTMVTDMSYQCRIVEIFITHADWFFSTDENEDITNRNFPLSTRDVDPGGRPLTNQNLLLNNLQKMEHGQAKDVSAKDLVSSIIGAANRKVRQKMKRHTHSSHEEPIEERDIDKEIELRLRHLKPEAGMETRLRNGVANGTQKPNGTKAERRHSEDSSTSSLSTRTPSEDCTSPRKMSVDSLDSLQTGPLKSTGGAAVLPEKERAFYVVRQTSNKRSTWNGMQPDRDYSAVPEPDFPTSGPTVKRKDPVPEKQSEGGVLKTYTGLSANMQERIRQFELETKALLQRDLHRQKKDTEQRELDRQRIEMEWQKAKKDLEQDDFLDQLADNPSVAKKISDITQKIQSLQNSHNGQWSSKELETKFPYAVDPKPHARTPSSSQALAIEQAGRRDFLTHGCHPLPPSRNLASMKRVSSVESFVGGQNDEGDRGRSQRTQGRMWGRANSRRKAVNPVPPNNDAMTTSKTATSPLQPSAKWCGSLDSLREYYEQTAQEEAGKDAQPALQSTQWQGVQSQPRVPPYQPPPHPSSHSRSQSVPKPLQGPLSHPPVPGKMPTKAAERESSLTRSDNPSGLASDGETSFQRNENTLITATMSTTKHTISTTSSTAVMTATIVARSSKPTTTPSAMATVFKGNSGTTGSLPAEGQGPIPIPKPVPVATVSPSKEKKGDGQKRLSQGTVCENGFKKGRASPPPVLRKSSHLRNLKRRHTVGGTKDFEKFRLLVGSQFDTQDDFPANRSAWERLRPAVPNDERSMKSWLRRERLRTSSPDLHGQVGHVMVVQPFSQQPQTKSQDAMDVDLFSSREEKRPMAGPKSPPALESQV